MRSSRFALLDRRLVPPPDRERVSFLRTHDIAHRGLWDREVPENSLAAAARAIAGGYAIECDVRLAADGMVIVFHDSDTRRLCGLPGRIDAMSAATIATLGLAGTDLPPPPLPELLARIAGRVALLIEVKTEGLGVAAICLAVRRALEGYLGPVAVMSFNPEVPRWFAAHAPRIVRGLVVEERSGIFDPIRRRLAVRRARPEFLAYDVRALPSRLPAALRRHGLPVLTWTVRTRTQRRIAARHADRPIFERGGRA